MTIFLKIHFSALISEGEKKKIKQTDKKTLSLLFKSGNEKAHEWWWVTGERGLIY